MFRHSYVVWHSLLALSWQDTTVGIRQAIYLSDQQCISTMACHERLHRALTDWPYDNQSINNITVATPKTLRGPLKMHHDRRKSPLIHTLDTFGSSGKTTGLKWLCHGESAMAAATGCHGGSCGLCMMGSSSRWQIRYGRYFRMICASILQNQTLLCDMTICSGSIL